MIDLAFMQTLIDAAGNLVFQLIINSIRELYLQHLERFRPIVADRPRRRRCTRKAAAAVAAGRRRRARPAAVERLAAAQEARMLGEGTA